MLIKNAPAPGAFLLGKLLKKFSEISLKKRVDKPRKRRYNKQAVTEKHGRTTADVPCKLNNEKAKDEPEILERIYSK